MLDKTASAWLFPVTTTRKGLASQVMVATVAVVGAIAARLVIERVIGGVAPFILTFPAAIIATLIGGTRAGMIAAVGLQLLTIVFVFPNWVAPHGGISIDLANVILSTLALAGTIWTAASYRHAAASLRQRSEEKLYNLSLLNAEMDHRTKNNYQIAAGLLAHQSLSSLDPAVARELDMAAARLQTIASVYQDIPAQMGHTGSIDLADHLGRIVSQLRSGATSGYIEIRYHAEHVQVANDVAIVAGLIVNEWITNALKYAFNGSPGSISVDIVDKIDYIRVMVVDDGAAAKPPAGGRGQGSDLMMSLATAVQGEVTIVHQGNTRCTLVIPSSSRS